LAVIRNAAAQTRTVSGYEIRLNRRKSARLFKRIVCADISEFESHMPSHAVRSPATLHRQTIQTGSKAHGPAFARRPDFGEQPNTSVVGRCCSLIPALDVKLSTQRSLGASPHVRWSEPQTDPWLRCAAPGCAGRCVIRNAAAQTRTVSGYEIRLNRRKSARLFKRIVCADISEFESHMPSHAVRSPAAKM